LTTLLMNNFVSLARFAAQRVICRWPDRRQHPMRPHLERIELQGEGRERQL
jgi:hypothetical protein